jgi:hypothetical protein
LRWFDNHTMMWRSMQAKYLSSVGKRQFIRISVLPWRYAIYRTLNYIGFENDVVTSFADLPFSIHCIGRVVIVNITMKLDENHAPLLCKR